MDSSRRDATLEAHLQPVCNVFGDFLEIFPKWYVATVLAEIRGSTLAKGIAAKRHAITGFLRGLYLIEQAGLPD